MFSSISLLLFLFGECGNILFFLDYVLGNEPSQGCLTWGFFRPKDSLVILQKINVFPKLDYGFLLLF